MFEVIIFIFLIFLFVSVPFARFVPLNLHKIIVNIPKDIYRYFKYKKYNECSNFGYIKIMNGYFGSGKSLSAVDEVIGIFKRYNGLLIWSSELNTFIRQKITIISNLELKGVPFIPFENEYQFIDYQASPGEVLIFLVDEIGTVWNNRNFKEFNPDVFNNIVQSRKRKIAIYGTLPLLVGTDVNIRRYTDDVVVCSKTWRILKHSYYKAKELENCSDTSLLTPHRVCYKFVTDRMYNQYNTYAMIDKLKKDMLDGKLMSYRELDNGGRDGSIEVASLNRKARKRKKKVVG